MKVKLTEFDSAKYLTSQEAIEAYLKSAFATNDEHHIINAIGNVIRAQGMTKTAKKAKLDRSNLYDTFGNAKSDPHFSTVIKVMDSFGYHLSLTPKLTHQQAGT
jgi:probable addiction module antidote protein